MPRAPDGLIDRKAPGKAPTLTPAQRAALAGAVEAGPEPWRDGVVRGLLIDLVQSLWEELRVSVSEATVGRELRALGFRKLSAAAAALRPGSGGGGSFQKSLPERLAAVRDAHPGRRIELWWQDEARVGQKNKLTRRWARGGTRPRALHAQRTAWAYLFGAICPAEGQGRRAGHAVLRHRGDAGASRQDQRHGRAGCHAVLLLDQAGWHLAGALVVPRNISLLPLPPRSPELNPVQNVWEFLRDNCLSNRVFTGYDDIVAHCRAAWNDLIDQPWRIRPSADTRGQRDSDQCGLVLMEHAGLMSSHHS
jgi:transposase